MPLARNNFPQQTEKPMKKKKVKSKKQAIAIALSEARKGKK